MPQQICSGFSLRPAQGRPVPPRSLFAAMQTVKDYPVVASFSRSGYKVKCAATVVGASAAAVPGASGSAGLPTEANNEVAVNSVGQPLAAVTNSTRPAVGTDEDEDMQILEVCQRLEDRIFDFRWPRISGFPIIGRSVPRGVHPGIIWIHREVQV